MPVRLTVILTGPISRFTISIRSNPFYSIPARFVGYNQGYIFLASLDRFPGRGCWRVRYTLTLGNSKVRRARYPKTKGVGNALRTRVTELEQATRDQVARNVGIKRWVGDGFLTSGEATIEFPGWEDTAARDPDKSVTDFDAILDATEDYALRESGDPNRKAKRRGNAMVQVGLV